MLSLKSSSEKNFFSLHLLKKEYVKEELFRFVSSTSNYDYSFGLMKNEPRGAQL